MGRRCAPDRNHASERRLHSSKRRHDDRRSDGHDVVDSARRLPHLDQHRARPQLPGGAVDSQFGVPPDGERSGSFTSLHVGVRGTREGPRPALSAGREPVLERHPGALRHTTDLPTGGPATMYPEFQQKLKASAWSSGQLSRVDSLPMKRAGFALPLVAAVALATLAGPAVIDAQRPAQSNDIRILPVRGNVFMLVGGGGNIVASVGRDGVLLVDTGNAAMARVVAAVEALARQVTAGDHAAGIVCRAASRVLLVADPIPGHDGCASGAPADLRDYQYQLRRRPHGWQCGDCSRQSQVRRPCWRQGAWIVAHENATLRNGKPAGRPGKRCRRRATLETKRS